MARNQASTRLDVTLAATHGGLAAIKDHYDASGLQEVPVPVLVGITGACENVSTLFGVNHGDRLHLTQTGQLALEHILQFARGVYCVTRSFRTDYIDERHLSEFTLIEEEFATGLVDKDGTPDAVFPQLLAHIEASVRACLIGIRDAVPQAMSDVASSAIANDARFERITYDDAIALLARTLDAPPSWGDDLRASHEQALLTAVARESNGSLRPLFVTHYPIEIKFFNMAQSRLDARVVLSADLLVPFGGEAVGSAVREHDPNRLERRLRESTMFRHIEEKGLGGIEDFEPYLKVVRSGRSAPHAGYGIGLERILQFALGEPDIRECSAPYLLSSLMGFAPLLEGAQSGSASPGF